VKPISPGTRRALIGAPETGILTVEYSVGLAIKRRGWADEICDRSGDDRRFPKMTMRLNEAGLLEARHLREQAVYESSYEQTTKDLDELLKDGASPFDMATAAVRLVERLENAGMSSAGPRGYRDALQAYCRELVGA
jgi:hypothetical protein